MLKNFKNKYINNTKFYTAKAIVLAVFPLVLLILPVNFFDSGSELCLFTRLSGYHCYGCGMTRACMHLIHLDPQPAWDLNKISFIVLPMLCYLLLQEFYNTLHTIRKYRNPETSTNNV